MVQRSAVFITPHGITVACDLGAGWPVGADSGGLWIGDPRDASTWMEAPDLPGRSAEVTDFEDLNTEDLEWMPSEPFWPSDFPAYRRSTDDDGAETGGASDDQMDEVEPPRPLPTPATELVRIHADGGRSVILVDHLNYSAGTSCTKLARSGHGRTASTQTSSTTPSGP